MNKFAALINSGKPVLVDFYAEWCGPCKMMPPILKEVKDRLGDEATVVKVDVDKNPELASQLGIQGVPTLIVFQKGEIKWRQSGVIPANTLVDIIKQQLS